MLISDAIAKLIEEMLNEADGELDFQRNELALKVGCVPSQINYVITSRFTPERGYIIESRRGGGGYIRIRRVKMQHDEYLMHFFHAIGDELCCTTANVFIKNLHDNNLISDREKNIIKGIMPLLPDNKVRADAMRQIILAIMK